MLHSLNKDCLLDIILDNCDDLISVKDLNLRYAACNKSFLKHFEISNFPQIKDKSIYEIFPKDAKFIECSINKVIETLEPQMCKIGFKDSSGNKIFRQTNYPILKNGNLYGFLSISTDMSLEENLKSKLMEKVYQLNALLECLPLLVYMKNKKKEFIWGSKYTKDFLTEGCDKFADNILLNANYIDNIESEDDEYVLKNKKTLVLEKMIPDHNNSQHWYKIHKAPILSESDEVQGIVTIAENIDKEKMIECRKNLFLATLSHDLKNPLLAQINSLEMLYKGTFGKLTDSQKEMLELILESSRYMRDMLYSLMKTCKENNGIIKLQRKFFDINNLIKTCIREVQTSAQKKHIKIKYNFSLKTDKFYADERELRRVFGNILNNSVNYAYQNSIIDINVTSYPKKIFITFENLSDEIPEDLQKHIFDKYVCDNSLKSSFGVGLGLYFCKKVIEAHEGNIFVNANGNRNKFCIELPILDEESIILSEIIL